MQQLTAPFYALDQGIQALFGARRRLLGRFYAFIASIFTYVNPLFVKLSGETNTTRVMQVRGMVNCFISFYAIQTWEKPRTVVPKKIVYKLIFRGFLNITMFYILYWSLNYVNLQIALSVRQTSPMMTYILAVAIGQERLTWRRVACVLGILVGLCLIINPQWIFLDFGTYENPNRPDNYKFVVGMLIFSAFLKSIISLLLKSIKENDPMINNVYSASTNLVLCGVSFIYTHSDFRATGLVLFLFFLSGLTSFTLQTFTFKAIQLEDASTVSLITSLNVFWSFLVNLFILGTVPEAGAVVGSLVTLAFLILLTLEDKKETD